MSEQLSREEDVRRVIRIEGRTGRILGLATLALLLVCAPAAAQSPVAVDVRLLGEDGVAIPGALVRALDVAGDTVTGQVTNADGRARIIVRPGRYQFVVHHVRYQDWSSGLIDVDATTGTLEFRVADRAIGIEGVDALTDRRCDTPPEEGPAILRMYQLMQVALGRVMEGERDRAFKVREIRRGPWLRQTINDTTKRTDGRTQVDRGGGNPLPRASDRTFERSRPTATPDAAFLTRYGWVEARLGYNDHPIYHVPVPTVLTSDVFRETHCFRTAQHADSGWSGLRFEPMRGSPLTPDRGDVRGTVWIDTISSRPIRVDFEYASLNSIVVRTDGPVIEQRLRVVLNYIAEGLMQQELYSNASRYRISPHVTFAFIRDQDYGGHVLFEEVDDRLVTAQWEILYPVLQTYITSFAETMGGSPLRYRYTGRVLEVTGG